MASPSKQHHLQQKYGLKVWHSVEWEKLWEGCIIWIRDKDSIDQCTPGLSNRLRGEERVYGHPCVILCRSGHNLKDRIVTVAPLTSHPHKPLGDYMLIVTGETMNDTQLSLRNSRRLEKISYVKKTCFEIDPRMLAPYSGAAADSFRLTKGSMKKLLAGMAPVIKWGMPPVPCYPERREPLPGVGPHHRTASVLETRSRDMEARPMLGLPCVSSHHRTASVPETWSRDVEAQPLLRLPDPPVKERASRVSLSKAALTTSTLQAWHLVEPVVKLVLCIPLLLVLIAGLVIRFIVDIGSKGPLITYDAAAQLLLTLWRKNLSMSFEDWQGGEVV